MLPKKLHVFVARLTVALGMTQNSIYRIIFLSFDFLDVLEQLKLIYTNFQFSLRKGSSFCDRVRLNFCFCVLRH